MRVVSVGLAVGVGVSLLSWGSGALGQELKHQFVNPSFGGNPFNSDHLLGVATAQRPERKQSAEELRQLTEGEQFARQIQSRLLSALSSGLVEAITGADPGTSGEFAVGDQTISFEKTLTEIRLKITSADTGEVTEIVVPVLDFKSSASAMASLNSSGSSAVGGLTTSAGSLISPLQSTPLGPSNVTGQGLGQ